MTYIGVHCKTPDCDSVVALQESPENLGDASDNPSVEHPFLIKCDTCGASHAYSNDDLSLFEG
jgi:hypothetical protein